MKMSQLRVYLVFVICYIVANRPISGMSANLSQATPATTTTTTTPPTTETVLTSSTSRLPIIINNQIPTVDFNCVVRYRCTAKLKGVTVAPKPCVRYCVKFIECPNVAKIRGKADQCFELDQTVVREHYESYIKANGTIDAMKVAMIDFPCRPGFLPDDMGRCREIW